MPWWSVVTLVTTLKNYFKNIQLFGIFPLFENKSCIKRKTVPEKHTGQIENIKVSIVHRGYKLFIQQHWKTLSSRRWKLIMSVVHQQVQWRIKIESYRKQNGVYVYNALNGHIDYINNIFIFQLQITFYIIYIVYTLYNIFHVGALQMQTYSLTSMET